MFVACFHPTPSNHFDSIPFIFSFLILNLYVNVIIWRLFLAICFVSNSRLFANDADLDLIAHALEEELPLEGNHFAFFGRLERANQCLVIIGNLVVVEELSKRCVGFALDPDPANVDQQLGALLIESALKWISDDRGKDNSFPREHHEVGTRGKRKKAVRGWISDNCFSSGIGKNRLGLHEN